MNSTIAQSDPNLDKTFERLFEIMKSSPFLESTGLGNEVPLYIQPYQISDQNSVDKRIKALEKRLSSEGYDILSIHLLDLVKEITSKGDRLGRLLEKEPSMPRDKMLNTMAKWTSAKDNLIPAIKDKFDKSSWQITFIRGCGAVYPFIRTHYLLENLQSDMDQRPIVFFFPGSYHHTEASGSELRLFGTLPHKGYYRAFNLDHFQH